MPHVFSQLTDVSAVHAQIMVLLTHEPSFGLLPITNQGFQGSYTYVYGFGCRERPLITWTFSPAPRIDTYLLEYNEI